MSSMARCSLLYPLHGVQQCPPIQKQGAGLALPFVTPSNQEKLGCCSHPLGHAQPNTWDLLGSGWCELVHLSPWHQHTQLVLEGMMLVPLWHSGDILGVARFVLERGHSEILLLLVRKK